MSVNITVSGKYTKSCLRHNLLNDPERVKKENENERRKMRIQQVRNLSKNIARKVLSDVEKEKERQLKKIEEIKAREMEEWRQNALAQQEMNYRSAIFHLGTAHRAAQTENAEQAKKKVQIKSRKPSKRPMNAMITSKAEKENILKNANVQTDITGNCYAKPPEPLGQKNIFNSSSRKLTTDASEMCSSEEECEEENSSCVSTELSSDVLECSISTFSDSGEICKPKPQCKSIIKLKKTAPVLIEVEPESDTSIINTPNIEDHHQQTNMHFSQVVSKKTPKKQKIKAFKATTEPLLKTPSTSAAVKKRFTQISDIIRQQKSSDHIKKQPNAADKAPGTFRVQKSPTKSKLKSPTATPQKSETSRVSKSPTKSKPKSPSASRPNSTQTTVTLATKSTSSIPSQRSTATRVQFYDYNNKFQKEYDQPVSAVEIHEPSSDETQQNAMEQAELSEKLQKAREQEMENLRQKSADRCQKAIEKEQVRRACEELTAKLDALTKQRPVLPPDSHQFASHHLAQVAAEKEIKLNNAVEDILKRPAVITCPVVNKQQIETAASPSDFPRPRSYDLNLGSAFTHNEINSLNSSDSCCSILLGYVNGQSKQIADDIKKYNKQNGEADKAKVEKLQNLLNRINRLRESLINELEKCAASSVADKERVQTMMDSIGEFKKERESIMIDGDSKNSISKRENDLKKKEAILEKKLREFYEIQKAAKKKERITTIEEDSENVRDMSKKSKNMETEHEDQRKSKMTHKNRSEEGDREAVQIEAQEKKERGNKGDNSRTVQRETKQRGNAIILEKESKNEQRKYKNNSYLSREQENEEKMPSSLEVSEEEFEERQKVFVDEKPVEIIIKVRGDKQFKKAIKVSSKSPRRLSTLIQSTNVKKIRKKFTAARSSESSSTSYRSLPPTIHNNVEKLLKNVPTNEPTTLNTQPRLGRQEEKSKLKKQNSNLNPLMAHYVQRLLGMSRTSINALGVSSSDIDTPSSSMINTTANLSAAETEQIASNRLENVQKFIEDNYSFIGELEESLRQSTSTDSSLKTIEVIWKKALKEQTTKKKHAEQGSQTVIEMPTKPAIKKYSRKQRTHVAEEKELVNKSTQLTDNCTQRIAELTEMINKVRQEKQKILETTLSSASENDRNSTEYLDLPDRPNNSGESTTRVPDSQLAASVEPLPIESPETATQLEKNKLTGMSRDSGISLSRPITVQESRESPTEGLHQNQSSTESLSAQFKKPKPPISIARYSPQLVEDIPHELSTIFEVDTPATSRVNTSIRGNNGQEQLPAQLHDERAKQIAYKKFPTFEEYARLNQLDLTQFDPEFSVQFEKEFNEFINLARDANVNDYEKFTSFSNYFAKSSPGDDRKAADDFLASLKLANLSFKKFPTRKEYLDKIGVSTSDMLDSQSLDNVEESRNLHSGSSTESLMNVENELKLRKILTRPFRQNALPNDKDDNSTPASLASTSPRKFLEKNGKQAEISGIGELTNGATSTDEQSDNLENQLKRMGINWPSVMKKKTMETQALSSSTSSSLGPPPQFTPRRKQSKYCPIDETSIQKETYMAFETTTQTEDGGRRLNFREFVTKELLKRTTTSSSLSFSDDSIASSILRSIIGSMTPSSHHQGNRVEPNSDRQKTSTPMASHSTSTAVGRSHGGISSVQLFSGESRLSSVNFNNSTRDTNQITGEHVDAESDKKL